MVAVLEMYVSGWIVGTCVVALAGLESWRAAALFPQSAAIDLCPRLQFSLLALRMKVSSSPEPLIHGHTQIVHR